MAYCYDHAIPYSVFQGRTVGPKNPQWLESDADRVVAYTIFKSTLCPTCGTKDSDWVDERGHWLDDPLYEAVTVHCFGCDETERMREAIPKDRRGIYVSTQRKPPEKPPEIVQREAEKKERDRLEEFPAYSDPIRKP